MADPKYPIFLFDGLDLMVSSSNQSLQGDIEPTDVRAGMTNVFDSDGRRVMLETKWSRIYAQVDLQETPASEEFREKLRDFLRAVNDPIIENPECDLASLMAAAVNRA
jgi:hypothetical protein